MDRERLLRWLDQVYATVESEIACDRVQELLPGLVELELSGGDGAQAQEQLAQLRVHLAQCADCAEEYRGLKAAVGLELQGRLPSAEESLSKFEAETGATVPHIQ